MKLGSIALNTMDLVAALGEAPEWRQLIPAGTVEGRDGRSWLNSQPEKILVAFKELGRDLPIDLEHSSELKARLGEPAPAVGWINELAVRDGEIWGMVEWNAEGKKLIGERAYRYMSPVIVYNRESGIIVGLTSVGLTNQPNLELPALNSQQGGNPENKEDEMLKAILVALGLPETATDADAVAKIKELKNEVSTANNRAETPSLDKFVPRSDYDTAVARATNAEKSLGDVKKEQLETAVNAAIDQALKDGKITPATADYHKAQCRQEGGLALFSEFCKAAPVVGGESGLAGKTAGDTQTALNSEQQKVAEMFGNSAEDIAKYGK
ncbi:MAG: hypothetical protein VR65_19985 [Desulfobulbaceae bacterium BRH_c16a]|nr:MAG: hypothetical protein VR65_19985 [Desulfobulbaceae bacterium BRH_c16a]